jgi:pimeloyl-ACP methyl ester carboxylesterase
MGKMMRLLLSVVALVYLGLCVALFIFQRRLIYFPQPAGPLHGAISRVLAIDGEQVRINEREHAGSKAVVYFGGNAEPVASSLPGLVEAFPDRAIYQMNYRGFGGSTGTPSEAVLFSDSLALFDMVRQRHPDITVIGRSLGTGVAVHLASLRPVERLVLVTPYDSLQALAVAQFPYFPVRWLLQDKFESWRYAPAVRTSTLLLMAENDEVIPSASTRQLLTRFGAGVAKLVVVAAAGHNTILESPEYASLLKGDCAR